MRPCRMWSDIFFPAYRNREAQLYEKKGSELKPGPFFVLSDGSLIDVLW